MRTQKVPFNLHKLNTFSNLKTQTSFIKYILILKNGKLETADSDIKSPKEMKEIKLFLIVQAGYYNGRKCFLTLVFSSFP